MKICWCYSQNVNGKTLNACRLFKDRENAIKEITKEMHALSYRTLDVIEMDGVIMSVFWLDIGDYIVRWFFINIEVE